MEYTVDTILSELKGLSDEKRYIYNKKNGVGDNQFGIPMGVLRNFAKKITKNHELGLELWRTNNYDAMILAVMIFDEKKITEADFTELIKSCYHFYLIDEITTQVLSKNEHAKKYLYEWMNNPDPLIGRAGWMLGINLLAKNKLSDTEITALIDEIEGGLREALPDKQWAMNRCLCEIGIRYDEYTEKCVEIGEKLGVYKDMKVAKGCTSAYAPEWIRVGRGKINKN